MGEKVHLVEERLRLLHREMRGASKTGKRSGQSSNPKVSLVIVGRVVGRDVGLLTPRT